MWSSRSKSHVRHRLAGLVGATTRSNLPSNAEGDGFQAPPAERGTGVLIDSTEESEARRRGVHAPSRIFFTWDPRARKAALVLIAGLGLIVAWWWISGQPKPVTPVDVEVSAGVPVDVTDDSVRIVDESQTVVVHVVGKVAAPGVVELPAGSRVQDAIEAAGGATKDKALESVNLARVVVDGEQIDVGASGDAGGGSSRISLNSANAQQLQEIPGVGPVIAERIVEWRTKNGPFHSVAELAEVSGIGPSMLERIEDQVGM